MSNIIGICCHDAGGAELISSYVLNFSAKYKFIFCLGGPSKSIFKKKLGNIVNHSLDEMIKKCDKVYCGTGRGSYFEILGIKKSINMRKHCVAFLDHWVNYEERFRYKNRLFLPDEIWVSDIHAKKISSLLFKNTKIKLIKNYFLTDIKNNFKKNYWQNSKKSSSTKFLYISDNNNAVIKSDFRTDNNFIFRDEVLVKYFLENLSLLTKNKPEITIRPHPVEKNAFEKYKSVFDEFNITFSIGGENDLLQDISKSDIVIGGDSMALVVAITCGKRTFTCIPSNATFTLPFAEIEKLSKIKRKNYS